MVNSNIFLSVIGFFGGFYLLFKSAGFFVDAAVKISNHFHISRLTTGIVIAGIATTAPETTVSVISSLRGFSHIAFGNAYGSIICNTGFALGLAYLFAHRQLSIKASDIKRMMFPLAVVVIVSVYFALNLTLSRIEGGVLLVLFALYMKYNSRKKEGKREKIPQQREALRPFLILIISLACIILFSRVVVDSAATLARFAGISDNVVGLTIIALGTSLPEISASISAAIKNEPEIAVGNIVGANILNLLLVIGLASLARPISIGAREFIQAVPFAIVFIVLLFLTLFVRKRLGIIKAFVLMGAYLAYNVLLFVQTI